MPFLATLLAFLETPTGLAAVAALPNLVTDLFRIGAQKGLITADDVATYIGAQSTFDALVPKKVATPAVIK